mmetsp:Transcript_1407/g.1911  ORF Transcript_1407/g.1911 Transcript_1407/m.1911 type:complete len:84 (-) Transcript_1407:530-781(-)
MASGHSGDTEHVESLLDLLSHLRVTLCHVLSASELMQSKRRVEDQLKNEVSKAIKTVKAQRAVVEQPDVKGSAQTSQKPFRKI